MEATSPGTTEEDAEADNMQNKTLSAEDTNVQNVQSTDKIEVCTESDKTMASLQKFNGIVSWMCFSIFDKKPVESLATFS